MPRKNIITVLTQEHREVDRMLSALAKQPPAAKRDALFAKLDQALTTHAEFEEESVYSHLRREEEGQPLALEAEEEHMQIKRLLAEMAALEPTDPHWEAKLKVLTENVEHHVEEEEKELLPQLREVVDNEQLLELSTTYEEAKAAAAAREPMLSRE